jgi:hypothetical protein
LAPGANDGNGRPLTEIVNLKKKSRLFIEFPFICLNILKFVERMKAKFSIQTIQRAVS